MENRARDNGDGSSDRISALPEPILHHILCFLDQKRAAKTCVLSKAWRYLWCTRPKFRFVKWETVPRNKEPFLSVVDRTLQAYHDRKLRLPDFTLHAEERDGGADLASFLNKWIPIIMQNMGVVSFDLVLYWISAKYHFELPALVFESDSIQNLSLVGCKVVLKSTSMHCLKHLQKLHFVGVDIPEEILDNILWNCPFLEDVDLSCCTGFKRIKLFLINKPANLKQFRYSDNGNGVIIEAGDDVQTPLRTMLIENCVFSVNPSQLFLYSHLTRLEITNVQLSSDLFSCSFSCLEELELYHCYNIKEFNLSSGSIMKLLDIYNPNMPFKATIDAPGIVSFNYKGILPQSISFATTSDGDWKSKILLFTYSNEHTHCFNKLHGFLKSVSRSEITLVLAQNDIQRLRNQLHTEDPPLDDGVTNNSVGAYEAYKLPVVVDHLRIWDSWLPSDSSSAAAADFLNNLFHMFRPSFIYMEWLIGPDTKFHPAAEFLLENRKMVQCYFWQHVLEGVSLQVNYGDQSEWRLVDSTSPPEFCVTRRLRLQLKWRELR